MDPWLTLAEIAEELRVNPATVRQWVSKGQLTASRAGVRKWIVRRSDLDRMLAETNSSADDILQRIGLGARPPRRPAPTPAEEAARADEPTSAPTRTRKPRTPKQQGAVELLQHAIAGYEDRKSTRLNSSHLGISYA